TIVVLKKTRLFILNISLTAINFTRITILDLFASFNPVRYYLNMIYAVCKETWRIFNGAWLIFYQTVPSVWQGKNQRFAEKIKLLSCPLKQFMMSYISVLTLSFLSLIFALDSFGQE